MKLVHKGAVYIFDCESDLTDHAICFDSLKRKVVISLLIALFVLIHYKESTHMSHSLVNQTLLITLLIVLID